jgi:hypothetical protein
VCFIIIITYYYLAPLTPTRLCVRALASERGADVGVGVWAWENVWVWVWVDVGVGVGVGGQRARAIEFSFEHVCLHTC